MMYFLKNDLMFIVKKKYKIITLLILLNLLSLLLNFNLEVSLFDKITFSMGTNMSKERFNVFELMMFIFNNLVLTYISLSIFIKDLSFEMDNIFTRLKVEKWCFFKLLILFIIVMIIKLFKYFIIMMIICIFDKFDFDLKIFYLIMTDITYTLIIILIYLLMYFFSSFLFIRDMYFYIICICLFLVLPYGVFDLFKYIFQLLILLFILSVMILVIIKFFHKKIIEVIKE